MTFSSTIISVIRMIQSNDLYRERVILMYSPSLSLSPSLPLSLPSLPLSPLPSSLSLSPLPSSLSLPLSFFLYLLFLWSKQRSYFIIFFSLSNSCRSWKKIRHKLFIILIHHTSIQYMKTQQVCG